MIIIIIVINNLAQKTRSYNNQQKKENFKILDFAVPANHRIKWKECEKKDKYVDLAWELKKKLCNMKVTITPIVIGAFCTVTNVLLKGLKELEIRGRVETFESTTLLRAARILRESGRIEETCCHYDTSERPLANTDDGQNTETSRGDLRRRAVTQTPVKNHQLILMWKTLKE